MIPESASEIKVEPKVLHKLRENVGYSITTMQGALLLGRDLVAYYLKQKIVDMVVIERLEDEFCGRPLLDPDTVNYALLFSLYNERNPLPDSIQFNTDQINAVPLVVCYVPTSFNKVQIMGYVPSEVLREVKEEAGETEDVFRVSFNHKELAPIENILEDIHDGKKWRLDS